MSCPRCGQPTPPDARFCTSCGASLAGPTCRSCGQALAPDAHFCTACGAPADATIPVAASAPTPPVSDPLTVAPVTAPEPAAEVAATPMAPTSTVYVPGRGMSAWATPDPATTAIARLAGGTPLQVVERRGDWAHVQAVNGWTGWVDARYLAAAPEGAVGVAGDSGATGALAWMRYLGIAGGAIAVLGALLPWIDLGGATANAFDVPAVFLVDYQTDAGNGFNIGLVVIVLAVAVAAAVFVPTPWAPKLIRPVAGALIAIGAVYLVQLTRLAGDSDISLTDVMGYGPIITIIGGIAATFTRAR